MTGTGRFSMQAGALAALLLWQGAAFAQSAPPTPATPAAPEASQAAPSATPPAAPAPEAIPQAAPPSAATPQAAEEPKASGDASTAQAIDIPSRPVALTQGDASWDEGYSSLLAAFAKVTEEAQKAGLKPAGRPLAVFLETNDNGFRFEAMLPLEHAPPGKDALTAEVKIGASPAGKAIKFQHRASYDEIDSTYEAITAWLDEKGLEARNLFVEEYLTTPSDSSDASLEIDIYVFLK